MEKNPFRPSRPPRILGQVGGKSEAHVSKDGKLVQLQYRLQEDQVREICYLKYMAGVPGVPKLYYYNQAEFWYDPPKRKYVLNEDWKPVVVVEKLDQLEKQLNEKEWKMYFLQAIELLKQQFTYGVANSHFFINQKDEQIYFTDIRLWEPLTEDRKEMLEEAIIYVCEFFDKRTTNPKLKSKIEKIAQQLPKGRDITINAYNDIISTVHYYGEGRNLPED